MPDCPGCGEEFSLQQNFCRHCGEDVSEFVRSSTESGGSAPGADRSGPTPEQRVEQAAGSFSETVLTRDDRLNDHRIVDYLSPTERLEYLFWHQYKGLRISYTDGSEETPHHDSTTDGNRFLLVSDRRVCYVAGLDSHDEHRVFGYDELTDVEPTSNLFTQWLTLVDDSGVRYRFAETGTHASDIEPAAEYIQERIDESESARTPRRAAEQHAEGSPTERTQKQASQQRAEQSPAEPHAEQSPAEEPRRPSSEPHAEQSATEQQAKQSTADRHAEQSTAEQRETDAGSRSRPGLEPALVSHVRRGRSLRETIEDSRQEIQRLHDEIDSLRSGLERADGLVDDGEFETAERRLTELASRLETARETASRYGLDDLQTEVSRLEQRRQNRLAELEDRQRRYRPLRDEAKSIRSSLDHTQTLVDRGELEKAESRLTALQSDLSMAIDAASQYQFDDLEDELTTLEQRCEDSLGEITDRGE